MAKGNRFAALRQLRDQRQDEDTQELPEQAQEQTVPTQENKKVDTQSPATGKGDRKKKAKSTPSQPAKRRPGRPPGRRSDPNYTQISAYIPLELLLEVQDKLAEERREKVQRTARPVSDLVEELLGDWLKKRKRKNSAS